MTNFEKWKKEFDNQNLYAFNNDDNGLLWLKVRAIGRKEQFEEFITQNKITLTEGGISKKTEELFGLLEKRQDAHTILDKYLRDITNNLYAKMGVDEAQLKNDLYKIQYYAWGGDQNNSLDKHFVSRYIKVISDYNTLLSKKGEIAQNSWDYVQTSWYNNWTSYLIETLFKRHQRVVSAVGEIKSVDFFLENIPIDLKVTFFPAQYMDEKLKIKLDAKELTWLKKKAKEKGIVVGKDIPDTRKMYMLSEKLSQNGHTTILDELNTKRKEVVQDAMNNPTELMQWLYEKQGEMRFGAENRLFVILVDTTDMGQSWKMKRAFDLIEPAVKNYLDNFTTSTMKNIRFVFKSKVYESLADILFVVKQ